MSMRSFLGSSRLSCRAGASAADLRRWLRSAKIAAADFRNPYVFAGGLRGRRPKKTDGEVPRSKKSGPPSSNSWSQRKAELGAKHRRPSQGTSRGHVVFVAAGSAPGRLGVEMIVTSIFGK
jgi:hypothetical protein